MSRSFIDAIQERTVPDSNIAYTENGATAFKSTNSAVLDFFATGGAMRDRDETSIIGAFNEAFNEDPLLAIRSLFYFRDVRGGQGERRVFTTIVNWLADYYPDVLRPNLTLFAEYGRWDDMYALVGTKLEEEMWGIVDVQLALDKRAERPSLLAKWLKSENASSKETKRLAAHTRKALNMTSKEYRKTLSSLRKKIDLVEQHMSDKDWTGIDYSKVPSKANLQYRQAFWRNDADRYGEFLTAVENGEAKINTGTLYPYEIVSKVMNQGYFYKEPSDAEVRSLDAMWNNLPNYFGESETRGLVVADVSGSMHGRPMEVSISLAMYVSERNKGPFHDKFITFSAKPRLQSVEGENIKEKVDNLSRADWDMNTDIEAVFDLILCTAIEEGMKQDDLPTHLYICSDMQFDEATSDRRGRSVNERLFQTIEKRYSAAGFKMPFLVFWNVNARNDNQPMSMDERGFQLVSGCSPSIFTSLLSNAVVSAYDLMLEVLNSERYAAIKID